MKAMIMSAGKGTRLGEITRSMPKVLVDINGKSLLQHAVEYRCSYGFDDIIVNVHYLDDMDAKLHSFSQLMREDANVDSAWTVYHPQLGRKLYKSDSSAT